MPEGYNPVVGQAENGSVLRIHPGKFGPQRPDYLAGGWRASGQRGAKWRGGARALRWGYSHSIPCWQRWVWQVRWRLTTDQVVQTDNTPLPEAVLLSTGALDEGSDSGLKGDQKTKENTPTLIGQVPVGSRAAITLNGQTYPVTVIADGNYTFVHPSTLPDGTCTPCATGDKNA